MDLPLYLNGRVLDRDHGGIRRYTAEVAKRLPNCEVVRPASARFPWSARLWEQTKLAETSADGVLLSLAHSGPLRHPRHVFMVHDLFVFDRKHPINPVYGVLLRGLLPRLATNAAHVITNSKAVADETTERFGLARSKISIASPGIADEFGPGVKADAREELSLDPDRPVVVALLDPTPRKNGEQVANVLRRVRSERPSIQVVVAGRQRAAAFARGSWLRPASVVRSDFRDLGPVDDAQLATMFRAADVFLSLSDAEGFGLPMVEAAVCGAAVVTTPVPSISEHAPAAAIVVQSAADALVEVCGLLDDPGRRQDLADNAVESLGDLRWDRTAATLEHVVNEVVRV